MFEMVPTGKACPLLAFHWHACTYLSGQSGKQGKRGWIIWGGASDCILPIRPLSVTLLVAFAKGRSKAYESGPSRDVMDELTKMAVPVVSLPLKTP